MDIVTIIEEILNGKLHFLCSEESAVSFLTGYVLAECEWFMEASIIEKKFNSYLIPKLLLSTPLTSPTPTCLLIPENFPTTLLSTPVPTPDPVIRFSFET